MNKVASAICVTMLQSIVDEPITIVGTHSKDIVFHILIAKYKISSFTDINYQPLQADKCWFHLEVAAQASGNSKACVMMF